MSETRKLAAILVTDVVGYSRLAFTSKHMSPTEYTDGFAAFAFSAAATVIDVLEQCGDDLSRDNVMRQAANIKNFHAPMLLPGMTINTSPDYYSPIRQLQLTRFNPLQNHDSEKEMRGNESELADVTRLPNRLFAGRTRSCKLRERRALDASDQKAGSRASPVARPDKRRGRRRAAAVAPSPRSPCIIEPLASGVLSE